MNRFTLLLSAVITGLLLTLPETVTYAQEDAIIYTIANDVSTSTTLEFDLLLYDPDPSQDFQLHTVDSV
jgi:hypothetical protein